MNKSVSLNHSLMRIMFLGLELQYEAGSAYRMQPYIRSNARAVDRSLAWKIRYSVSDGPLRSLTVCGCPFRASATSRGNSTEHPQDRHNTRRTPVHREVRPSKLPPACSPRRVRARRRGQLAFKMRFRTANPGINRSWVNCDQVSFWFQKQKRSPFKSVISR